MERTSLYSYCLPLVALVCVSAVAISCAGPLPSPSPADREGITGLLPKFPVDDSSGRVASGQIQSMVDGSVFWEKSDGAVVNGMHMEITSTPDSLEYVVYRHEVGFETSLYELTLDLTATGDGAWVGIADYTEMRWQLFGPFTSSEAIPVSTGGYRSTGFNNFFMAVIAFDGVFVDVESTTLSYESGVVLPSTFAGTMQPVFDANCMPCHNSATARNGIILDTYWRAFENADAALTKTLADHEPTASGSMTTEEKASFQAWVDSGKEFGEVVTYTNFIQNLTSNSCSPCHTGGNSQNGVNWDTYTNAFPFGELAWQRIKADVMPKFGPPLPDADKDKWLAWVEQGKPE